MSTSQQALVRDSSTFANFKSWAQAMSNFLATAGWIQANDTGQVVWTATVLTLTQVAVSGGNAVYSYSSFTGPAPRVGMSVIITGFSNSGNNVTATLTAVSGGSSGTVTVATSTQVNETHAGSGTTTAQNAVPSTNSYVYEIWQPGDGLQTFYLKIQYGTFTSSSSASLELTIATGTNGAGTLTGFITGPGGASPSQLGANVAGDGATLCQSYFSGDSGRIGMMMWRDSPTAKAPFFFGIQRSLNSSGNPYGTSSTGHVTLLVVSSDNGSNIKNCFQGSIVFGVGVGNTVALNVTGSAFVCLDNQENTSDMFNGMVPVSPVFPDVGFFDNPLDIVGIGPKDHFTEGATYAIASAQMPYGVSHTYIASKVTVFQNCANANSTAAFLMRYD